MSGDKRTVGRAIAWVGAASAVVAGFDAISVAILLWKWVSVADLGIASLAATLFYFLDLVTEAGLSSVLIQRESIDDDTVSSVFWLNLIVSLGAFAVLLGVAPLVGYIQHQPIVGYMLIAYGTKLIYQNIYFVPAALLRRDLRFKELSIVRTVANAGDGITKIAFAAMGQPIWCFVAGPLARVAITGIGLQLFHPWRPRLVFQRAEARHMLSFGFKTTGSQYLQHFYNNIHYQIVGVFFGNDAVGSYRVAYELVLYPINWVSNVVAQIAFPAFSRVRGNAKELAAQFLQFSRQNLAVALPVLVLLITASPEILALAYPKVGDVSLPVRVLCIVGMLRAIDCLYLPLLDALGFAGRNFAIAGLAAVVLVTGDIVFSETLGHHFGFTAVAIGRMIGYPIVISVHAYLVLGRLELTSRHYIGHLMSLVAVGVAAVIPGYIMSTVMSPTASPAARLFAIAGPSLATLEILLSRFHGLGLRAIIKSFRR
ncbi:MAG TPA: oligosaccharide flippase family protein [Kofleriaceae bacterium]|nr:oligosaccharide flippase family protein [Kofleriaceae bacterium]